MDNYLKNKAVNLSSQSKWCMKLGKYHFCMDRRRQLIKLSNKILMKSLARKLRSNKLRKLCKSSSSNQQKTVKTFKMMKE